MRKLILSAIIALGLIGCTNGLIETPQPPKSEFVQYNLSLGGEIDIDTEPMGLRANAIGANDLIGVQVYAIAEDASLSAYAYGLFDQTDSLNVRLIKGAKYLFKTTLVKDAKTKLRRFPNDWSNVSNKPVFFFEPFHLPGTSDSDKGCELTNAFTYSNTHTLQGLDKGLSDIGIGSTNKVKRPNLVRYYGQTEFVAAEEASVGISLLQTTFGVRYSVKNLTEGSVRFQLEGAIAESIDTGNNNHNVVHTFDQLSTQTDYSEQVNVNVIWVNGGVETPIATKNISFTRAIRSILSIDMDKIGKVESGVQLSIDNAPVLDGETVEL